AVARVTAPADHPLVGPSIRPKIMQNMAAASRPAPSPSSTTDLSTGSFGRTFCAIANPAVPRMMLMRNIGRQPRPAMLAPMMKAPRMGPPTDATPMSGPKTLNAVPIMSRGKVDVMIAIPCGMRRAPKAPWSNRPATMTAALGARPHTSEASVNPAMPTRKMRRWPYLSPSRPPMTSSTPMASEYAEPSHLMSTSPPPRRAAMVGAAIVVSVESMRSSTSATSTTTRISQNVRWEMRDTGWVRFVSSCVFLCRRLGGGSEAVDEGADHPRQALFAAQVECVRARRVDVGTLRGLLAVDGGRAQAGDRTGGIVPAPRVLLGHSGRHQEEKGVG